ncbi:MAG TPA: NADP-dependent isocitrate dehydrogenase [Syntrophorhabdus sp.]|nr:NADP-dependent isocitrate dehydrogenase [Syntrophorhabdus sp.]MDI9557386.1 NADP-dependent isocitrate dehydrogenase [Pseudomonadota bacterium]OPX94393.1 MAG: Isocitrate dehydrogenase (NADP) [Syntrophorhabdus sp. PtaB.Bin027]OQB78036.1 MAG: Isocitrate dehydrogenase (NADP) [Deltaproteobacteria bacterium ADurb.Bin135]MBP8745786.1 NADP-dependent isocitrate dehydrogenase [Syntrophorhabdus sp.]
MTDIVTIPYIEGDGAGDDIWHASKEVLEESVQKAYGGKKRIKWISLLAGEKALAKTGELLPEETLQTVKAHQVAIKGPLTTPVGGGFRSVNVYLRQIFDLYVCMRPIRFLPGLPSPLKKPEHVNFIIFRENTEDLYKGIEWRAESKESLIFLTFLREKMGVSLTDDTGVGVKPISRTGTARFTRWVLDYAIKNNRKAVTVVHKGNIMKYTEGAFREWAYEVARGYADKLTFSGEKDKILFNDRIADNMFLQVILRPEDYDILLCPNLNGDYLSDACAALIGGLGVAPGANFGDNVAIFEPTHGSAPKYAGKDLSNPTSFLLCGAMLFRHINLEKAADILEYAIEETVGNKIVTYDLARQMDNVRPVRCSEYGEVIKKRIEQRA